MSDHLNIQYYDNSENSHNNIQCNIPFTIPVSIITFHLSLIKCLQDA